MLCAGSKLLPLLTTLGSLIGTISSEATISISELTSPDSYTISDGGHIHIIKVLVIQRKVITALSQNIYVRASDIHTHTKVTIFTYYNFIRNRAISTKFHDDGGVLQSITQYYSIIILLTLLEQIWDI